MASESERKRRHSEVNSDDDDDIPDADICQARCEEFAQVTGTDEALAQFYLQDLKWDLERALNAYFEANSKNDESKSTNCVLSSRSPPRVESAESNALGGSVAASTSHETAAAASDSGGDELSDRYIKLISWNIDGLDNTNILTRTRAVGEIINKEKPDIVFLQEVIEQSYDYFENKCTEYEMIAGNNKGYFTAFMFKKRRVTVKDHRVIPFYSSLMQRNLLVANISVSGVHMHVMTSHLESTRDHTQERVKQLTAAFNHIKAHASDHVVFGGDLNLRDSDLSAAGGVPAGVRDVWEACGSRPELRYTWDTLRNGNCPGFQGAGRGGKPRCRYDRLYFCPATAHHSQPPPPQHDHQQQQGARTTIKPVHFGLRGLEKIDKCQRFPSDHWALLAVFEITRK